MTSGDRRPSTTANVDERPSGCKGQFEEVRLSVR